MNCSSISQNCTSENATKYLKAAATLSATAIVAGCILSALPFIPSAASSALVGIGTPILIVSLAVLILSSNNRARDIKTTGIVMGILLAVGIALSAVAPYTPVPGLIGQSLIGVSVPFVIMGLIRHYFGNPRGQTQVIVGHPHEPQHSGFSVTAPQGRQPPPPTNHEWGTGHRLGEQ